MNRKRRLTRRECLPFPAVNRPHAPGHQPDLQKHHLLPRQLLTRGCFGELFQRIGPHRIGFNDFRSNGMLLPANEGAALRTGLPLHRGPHRIYNELVAERVGQIQQGWSHACRRSPDAALEEALMRLALLQRALRRRLLGAASKPLRLNRFDPLGAGRDYSELDAMADVLWAATQPVEIPILGVRYPSRRSLLLRTARSTA